MNDIYGGGELARVDAPLDPASVKQNAEQRREAFDRESQFTPHVGRWQRFVNRLKGR